MKMNVEINYNLKTYMNYQCNHILLKGPRKGETCLKHAWFPFFYPCFCKQHALMHNIPITKEEVNEFIKMNRLLTNNT